MHEQFVDLTVIDTITTFLLLEDVKEVVVSLAILNHLPHAVGILF